MSNDILYKSTYKDINIRFVALDKSESLGSLDDREKRTRSGKGMEREMRGNASAKKAERERNDGVVRYRLVLPPVYPHSTLVSTSELVSLTVEHVFLWFHPMLPPRALPQPDYHPCSVRTRFAGTWVSGASRPRAIRLFACTRLLYIREKKEKERETETCFVWTFACLPKGPNGLCNSFRSHSYTTPLRNVAFLVSVFPSLYLLNVNPSLSLYKCMLKQKSLRIHQCRRDYHAIDVPLQAQWLPAQLSNRK